MVGEGCTASEGCLKPGQARGALHQEEPWREPRPPAPPPGALAWGTWENQNQSLSGHSIAPSDLAGDSGWAPPAQDPDLCVPAEGTWGPCVVWQTEAGDRGRLHKCQEVQWVHPAPAAVPQALLWARPAGQLVRGSAWWWAVWGLCRVHPVLTDQSTGTWKLAGVWPTLWEALLENVLLLPTAPGAPRTVGNALRPSVSPAQTHQVSSFSWPPPAGPRPQQPAVPCRQPAPGRRRGPQSCDLRWVEV